MRSHLWTIFVLLLVLPGCPSGGGTPQTQVPEDQPGPTPGAACQVEELACADQCPIDDEACFQKCLSQDCDLCLLRFEDCAVSAGCAEADDACVLANCGEACEACFGKGMCAPAEEDGAPDAIPEDAAVEGDAAPPTEGEDANETPTPDETPDANEPPVDPADGGASADPFGDDDK